VSQVNDIAGSNRHDLACSVWQQNQTATVIDANRLANHL
jgi:hypothetical protein